MLQRNLIPHLIQEQFQQGLRSGTFQAATLFVDISGFTPLTESLMQHHKDGAEVLSEALGAIFGPLVSQVYARGGLIPLFAGDAFTAGLATAVGEGMEWPEALRFANASGALAVTVLGAQPSMPDRSGVEELMGAQEVECVSV